MHLFLGFFKAASLSLLQRNLEVRRQMYKSKQRQIPIYQVPARFFSLSAKKLLVDRQMLHGDTLCNCFCPSISAEEKNAELIRGNGRTKKPLQQWKETNWSTCYSSVTVASSVLQEFVLSGSRKCTCPRALYGAFLKDPIVIHFNML